MSLVAREIRVCMQAFTNDLYVDYLVYYKIFTIILYNLNYAPIFKKEKSIRLKVFLLLFSLLSLRCQYDTHGTIDSIALHAIDESMNRCKEEWKKMM